MAPPVLPALLPWKVLLTMVVAPPSAKMAPPFHRAELPSKSESRMVRDCPVARMAPPPALPKSPRSWHPVKRMRSSVVMRGEYRHPPKVPRPPVRVRPLMVR